MRNMKLTYLAVVLLMIFITNGSWAHGGVGGGGHGGGYGGGHHGGGYGGHGHSHLNIGLGYYGSGFYGGYGYGGYGFGGYGYGYPFYYPPYYAYPQSAIVPTSPPGLYTATTGSRGSTTNQLLVLLPKP